MPHTSDAIAFLSPKCTTSTVGPRLKEHSLARSYLVELIIVINYLIFMGFTVRVLFTLMLWLCFLLLLLSLPLVLGSMLWVSTNMKRSASQSAMLSMFYCSYCILIAAFFSLLACLRHDKASQVRVQVAKTTTHTHTHSIDKTRKNENQKKSFPSHSSKRVKAYQTPNLVALVFFSFIFLFCFEFPILEFATWPHLLQDRDEGNPCKGLLGYAVGSCCTIILSLYMY